MLQSSPMLVQPFTTTCACNTVPRPTETFSPTTQYGPISTPRSTLAFGCTMAVGWITPAPYKSFDCAALGMTPEAILSMKNGCVEAEEPRIGRDREHQLRGDDELIVDPAFRAHPTDVSFVLGQVHFHHEAVAWNNRTAEFACVDPGQVRRFARKLTRLEHDAAAQLR